MALPIPNEPTGRAIVRAADPEHDASSTPADDLEALLVQSIRVAVGSVAAAIAFGAEIVRRTLGEELYRGEEPGAPPLAARFVGATLGLAVETATRVTSVTIRTARTFAPWGSWVWTATGAQRAADRSMARFDARWQEVSPEAEEAAAAFARELVPEVARVLLDRLDVNAIVAERVDLDAIAARLDVDAVAARLDVDAVIERMDLPEIARGVIDELDLAAIAQGVIEELDMPALIRESTESVTGEVVDDLRYGAVDADRSVARIVDKILRRRRDVEPGPTDDDGAVP
jgi:hypothetical protein